MPWNGILRRPTQSAILSSLYMHKMLLYALVSSVAVTTTVTSALKRHSNFYSLAINLSKSSRSVLILANFGLFVALLCGRAAQRIFFGALRPQEVERLHDRLWFFVTESLLAFTIFRDDFDIPFVLMFGFVLFVKSFHWLASDRIEWMDQRPYPGPPVLFHIRMVSLLCLLWSIDISMFAFAVDSTTKNGLGGMVMFASEYAILMASALNITAKYLICITDLRRAQQRGGENAPPWQNKSMWVFYVELATDFLKLTTYLVFFMLIMAFHGLPLNIVRDVYLTGKSLLTRLRALFRYRAATRNMEERYPDASEQEMLAMTDHTCIICREEMSIQSNSTVDAQPAAASHDGPNTTPKKLPCGHIFHFYCLRSWLERQQNCPTCRRSVLDNVPQPQNRPQHPAPMQPQALPRQPNLFGFPHVQPAQADNNNRLAAMLGRFARNAAQPVAAPNPGQQNPNIQGWHAGQAPGVVIQYNIQYHNGQMQPPAPSANLQPIPPFAGFIGPDQNWRSWNLGQRSRPRTELTNTVTSDNQTAPESSNLSMDQESRTPAEAATEAALRRLAATSGPPPDEASSSKSNSATIPPKLPSLIPLDPIHVPSLLQTSHSSTGSLPSNSIIDTVHPHSHTPTIPQASTEEIVTDSQLMIMDQLTREAIDERLRVLENVSVTINRCMADLMRVRSTLPTSADTALPPRTLRDHAAEQLSSPRVPPQEGPGTSKEVSRDNLPDGVQKE